MNDEALEVLFVDDEHEILEALQRQMSLVEGYNFHFLSNPVDVYDLLERQKIHIIVADVVMPELDGITLLQDIKIKHPDIIRILLTAYGDYNTSLRAINEAEVFGFITKPWDGDYLVGHLNMAKQMINKKYQQLIAGKLPMVVVATWDDDTEITSIIHTSDDDLLANYFAKRVFMTSSALFGYKYRFLNNIFSLPLKESEMVVRGSLLTENGENYGLFIYVPDIDEETRNILDEVLEEMEMLLGEEITKEDLVELKTSFQEKALNLSMT